MFIDFKNKHNSYKCDINKISFLKTNPEFINITFNEKDSNIRCSINQNVTIGQSLITTQNYTIHSPINGIIDQITQNNICIKGNKELWDLTQKIEDKNKFDDYPSFLNQIGLLGMGGSMFPSSIKCKSSKNIHTLIINAVECEPYVTIDKTLLFNYPDLIIQGAKNYSDSIKANNIIIAINYDDIIINKIKELYPFKILKMNNSYPQGSEKLILKKLLKKTPSPGYLPFQYGYLIHNVASIRAIGKYLKNNIPVIERPLSIIDLSKNKFLNVMVPIGIKVNDILKNFNFSFNEKSENIILGGLMMGKRGDADSLVNKGTTSIFIIKKNQISLKERSCIHCSSCFEACPLNLHPIMLVKKIRQNNTNSSAFKTQMKECFLCGLCESVCPSNIQLLKTLLTGKKLL